MPVPVSGYHSDMRMALATTGMAAAAVLLTAAPAGSVLVAGDRADYPAQSRQPHTPTPRDRFIPPDRGGPCILPVVSSAPGPCPDAPGPLVTCVVPVGAPPGTLVMPDCPAPDPSPKSRVIPVGSLSR